MAQKINYRLQDAIDASEHSIGDICLLAKCTRAALRHWIFHTRNPRSSSKNRIAGVLHRTRKELGLDDENYKIVAEKCPEKIQEKV